MIDTRNFVRPVKAVALTAGLLAAAGLLAGCGGAKPSDNPAKSAENCLHALADRDPDQLCQLIADEDSGPAQEDTPEWNQCQSGINGVLAEAGSDELDKYAKATVEEATIDGDSAEVDEEQVTGVADPDISIGLARFDGKWYVVDL